MRMETLVGISMLKSNDITVLNIFDVGSIDVLYFGDCPPIVIIAMGIQGNLLLYKNNSSSQLFSLSLVSCILNLRLLPVG